MPIRAGVGWGQTMGNVSSPKWGEESLLACSRGAGPDPGQLSFGFVICRRLLIAFSLARIPAGINVN
jgi:hypothetical protein